MFIVANEIASRDQEHPGRISWECPGRTVPNELGTAQSGADMAAGEEGATGGAGFAGQQGISGEAGRPAPDITIVAMRIVNPLIVDIAGPPPRLPVWPFPPEPPVEDGGMPATESKSALSRCGRSSAGMSPNQRIDEPAWARSESWESSVGGCSDAERF